MRDEIIPFHLGVYQRFDRLGTWAAESASTGPYQGPDADIIDGAERGEVEYALTRPEWEARAGS
jgi:hypothetical protein